MFWSFPCCRNLGWFRSSPNNSHKWQIFHCFISIQWLNSPFHVRGGKVMLVCVKLGETNMAPSLTITVWFNDRHSDTGNIHHPRRTHFHWSIWLSQPVTWWWFCRGKSPLKSYVMFSLPGFGFVNSFALRTLCYSQRVLRWKMGWGKSLFKVPLDSNHDMFIDTYCFCYNIVRVLRPLNGF